MISYRDKQYLNQLEKRKGGYYYLKIEADIVNHFGQRFSIFKLKQPNRFTCRNHLTSA